jgi:hypothetical protein
MFNRLLLAAALALGAQAATAAPHALNLQKQGTVYSAGLSTQVGSNLVTHTEGGAFRDEFRINYSGRGVVTAWLDAGGDLDFWSQEGVELVSAGFVGIAGSELFIDTWVEGSTRFYSAITTNPFITEGSLTFFIEGIADNIESLATGSFSYSGGVNIQPLADGNTVPEPASLALAGLALLAALTTRRRRAD